MLSWFLILLCSLVIQIGIAVDDLPPYFPRCRRTDPQLEKCLLAATEEVRPYLKQGIPDFLPSVINFTVPKIVMEQGTKTINYKAVLNDIIMMGLEDYKFIRFNFDTNAMSFSITVEMPHIYLSGKYALNGNLFFAPIRGNGIFNVNITNTVCSIYHTAQIVKRNGMDHIQPENTIPKVQVGKITDYTFDGLFGNNKNLQNITNTIINNNLDVIVEELRPAVEKVLASIFDQVIFKSVTQIPYDKLYPK